MLKKLIFSNFVICLLLISMLSVVPQVYADGDAGGEGKDVSLTLVSSVPENGETEVAVDATLELLFNKNVVNLAVQEVNRNAITIKDVDGNAVAIDILFPDDQIDREHRRNIYVDPLNNLQPNTKYHLLIDSSFTAKNGTQIDTSHTVTFTTKVSTGTTPEAGSQVADAQSLSSSDGTARQEASGEIVADNTAKTDNSTNESQLTNGNQSISENPSANGNGSTNETEPVNKPELTNENGAENESKFGDQPQSVDEDQSVNQQVVPANQQDSQTDEAGESSYMLMISVLLVTALAIVVVVVIVKNKANKK